VTYAYENLLVQTQVLRNESQIVDVDRVVAELWLSRLGTGRRRGGNSASRALERWRGRGSRGRTGHRRHRHVSTLHFLEEKVKKTDHDLQLTQDSS
jgi:hypothetical protein